MKHGKDAIPETQPDRNDEDTFRRLYESNYHSLLSLACRYVGIETARDIVQDIFLRLWNSPEKYSDITNLRFYLYRSIRNSCLNFLRDQQTRDKAHRNMELESEDFFYNAILEEEVYIKMLEAIEKLPDIYRDVLTASLGGMNDKEISELLSISVDNVKTRKKRGKLMLKDMLANPLLLIFLNLL